MNSCPICSGRSSFTIFTKEAMPCYNLERHTTRDSALRAESGVVDFCMCEKCGFVFNAAFDEKLMNYRVDYENARTLSPRFARYLEQVVELLVPYIPEAGVVVDVGCGGGEFLRALRGKTPVALWGFDPALTANADPQGNLTFVKDYYRPDTLPTAPTLITLRHVLEHQKDPYAFLNSLLPREGARPLLYIEVPAWEWIVERKSFYAFSYEHCSYYSRPSLTYMLAQLGYAVRHCQFGFDDEYLMCIAEPGVAGTLPAESVRNLCKQSAAYAASLPELFKKIREEFLQEPGVLWGAAGKGTTLLNLLDLFYTDFPAVIDINPRRSNTFIPRTGQEVFLPTTLPTIAPRRVLLTNSGYRKEIETELVKQNVQATIVPLDEILTRSFFP